MTLEEALKQACERGMTHLSLWPVPSDDRKTTYWKATAAPSTQHRRSEGTSTDPVEAVLAALVEMPKAPKIPARELRVRAGNKDPNLYGSGGPGPVTAAVIEPRMTNGDTTQYDWNLKP